MNKSNQIKVIIFGASGNTGQFLVRYGLELGFQVSAFVRSIDKLKAVLGENLFSKITVFEGDALDELTVAKAMIGHNAAINVAAHRDDAQIFETICRNIVTQAEVNLEDSKRLWLFGGLPGLNVPHTKTIGSDLLGMRPILRSHKLNYSLLKNSKELDWSFMCPGPMFFARQPPKQELKITTEEMPYKIGKWSRFLPKPFHSLIILSKMNNMIVTYQDVARFVMENLQANGAYSKKRVGIAYKR